MDRGSILIADRGHYVTMDEWRRRKREWRQAVKRLKRILCCALIIGLLFAMLYRVEIAAWVQAALQWQGFYYSVK